MLVGKIIVNAHEARIGDIEAIREFFPHRGGGRNGRLRSYTSATIRRASAIDILLVCIFIPADKGRSRGYPIEEMIFRMFIIDYFLVFHRITP